MAVAPATPENKYWLPFPEGTAGPPMRGIRTSILQRSPAWFAHKGAKGFEWITSASGAQATMMIGDQGFDPHPVDYLKMQRGLFEVPPEKRMANKHTMRGNIGEPGLRELAEKILKCRITPGGYWMANWSPSMCASPDGEIDAGQELSLPKGLGATSIYAGQRIRTESLFMHEIKFPMYLNEKIKLGYILQMMWVQLVAFGPSKESCCVFQAYGMLPENYRTPACSMGTGFWLVYSSPSMKAWMMDRYRLFMELLLRADLPSDHEISHHTILYKMVFMWQKAIREKTEKRMWAEDPEIHFLGFVPAIGDNAPDFEAALINNPEELDYAKQVIRDTHKFEAERGVEVWEAARVIAPTLIPDLEAVLQGT